MHERASESNLLPNASHLVFMDNDDVDDDDYEVARHRFIPTYVLKDSVRDNQLCKRETCTFSLTEGIEMMRVTGIDFVPSNRSEITNAANYSFHCQPYPQSPRASNSLTTRTESNPFVYEAHFLSPSHIAHMHSLPRPLTSVSKLDQLGGASSKSACTSSLDDIFFNVNSLPFFRIPRKSGRCFAGPGLGASLLLPSVLI